MDAPSDWIETWATVIPPGSAVLDVACGSGRHCRWLAQQGHRVTGVDRNPEALAQAAAWAHTVEADLEADPWPFRTPSGHHTSFDAVVITNYLWRSLMSDILASVKPGGWLLYETFAVGHEAFGRPSNPDYLLRPGELLQTCQHWNITAYENRFLPAPSRMVQRIVAQRPVQ